MAEEDDTVAQSVAQLRPEMPCERVEVGGARVLQGQSTGRAESDGQ